MGPRNKGPAEAAWQSATTCLLKSHKEATAVSPFAHELECHLSGCYQIRIGIVYDAAIFITFI